MRLSPKVSYSFQTIPLLFLTLATMLLACDCAAYAQAKSAKQKKSKMSPLEISCQDVKTMLDDEEQKFLFLDCREQDEFDHVKIEGAVLLPMSEVTERVSEIEEHKNKPIIIHCHHGGRSLRVTNWLIQQGFTNVKSMAGGIDEWSETIDPTKPRY